MGNTRKASGSTAFGEPLRAAYLFGERPKTIGVRLRGSCRIAHHMAYGQRHATGNRGCNVGGSGLKPMRFADGRLRNRAQPKVYKRQADGTYA